MAGSWSGTFGRGCAGAATALFIVMMTVFDTGAATKLTVKGDTKAWTEIEAALTRMAKAQSYRAKGTMGGAGSMTMEFTHPDRFRTKMDAGGFAMETIMVGNDVRFRQGGGSWMCTGQPAAVPETDPGKMFGEVTASKGPAVTIDGVPTQSYTYAWKSEGMAVTTKLFVAVSNGLPKRIQMLGDKGNVEMQYDYYDYNAPITITLPACK